MATTKPVEQAPVWQQDCNDIVLYVVAKGLKDRMTLK